MEILLGDNKEVGEEVNAQKTKLVFMFHHQNLFQTHNVKAVKILDKFYKHLETAEHITRYSEKN
jgi:hypothetical protein